MNPGIPSCRNLSPPVAAPLCSCPCSSRGWGLPAQPNPGTLLLGQARCRVWKVQIHKPREAHRALPQPQGAQRGSGNAPAALASDRQDNPDKTHPSDTILFPDCRWQLHSNSMDLLENSVLYFSRWVWLDFGVGCLRVFFVLFCLVWVCLGFFTIFIQTALMAVQNSWLGMPVLLLKSLLIIDIANSASAGQCWQTAGLPQQLWE